MTPAFISCRTLTNAEIEGVTAAKPDISRSPTSIVQRGVPTMISGLDEEEED